MNGAIPLLLPSQIKALLLHESSAVRELAATFFNDRNDRDPDLVNLADEAVRQHGFVNVAREIVLLDFAPTTTEAWDNWRWLWSQTGDQRVIADDPDSIPFQRTLAKGLYRAPTEWVRQHEAELRSQSTIAHDGWDVIAAREEWSGWTPEHRWEHLKSYAANWEEEEDYPREVDGPYVEVLLEQSLNRPCHRMRKSKRTWRSVKIWRKAIGWKCSWSASPDCDASKP